MGRGSDCQSPKAAMALIDQVATAIATDEGRLRHLLIELIEAGRGEEAVAILADWDSIAAGDVLKKHEEVKVGEG